MEGYAAAEDKKEAAFKRGRQRDRVVGKGGFGLVLASLAYSLQGTMLNRASRITRIYLVRLSFWSGALDLLSARSFRFLHLFRIRKFKKQRYISLMIGVAEGFAQSPTSK